MLTVGSLFSGIGGLELGLERTGGFKTIWNCEIEAYPSAVLKKHWPEVPNLGDITKVDWNAVERPDVICGGFPCQDISTAGKGAGIKEGTRSGLWREFHKAIRMVRPKYALVENVSALSFRGLCIVLGDLAQIGFDAEWFTIRASDVGAPHRRERLFIVANANGERCDYGRVDWEERQVLSTQERQVAQAQQAGDRRFAGIGEGGNVSNAESFERNAQRFAFRAKESNTRFGNFSKDSSGFGGNGIWAVEPDVGRVANGIPSRVDRIKCLGNAVVPQVAQVVGEAILKMEKAGANDG